MFDRFKKTRKGKLEKGIRDELDTGAPVLGTILDLVDVYEQDNLDTIDKCKRDKRLELNKINGAIKQSIDAHGPITKVLIGSAAKRIYGALLLEGKGKQPKAKVSLRYVLGALMTGLAIGLLL